MSFKTWHDYGFGFCASDIVTTPEKILALAALKPEVYESVRLYLNDCFEGEKYDDADLGDDIFDEYEGVDYGTGLSAILFEVIDEFSVYHSTDFDGNQYLLYTAKYPWSMPENELGLTKEHVTEVFTKYIRMLTDVEVPIGYQSIANGG